MTKNEIREKNLNGLDELEIDELVGLLEGIEVFDCFSAHDIIRAATLSKWATEEQLKEIRERIGKSK